MTVKRIDVFADWMTLAEIGAMKRGLEIRTHLADVHYLGRTRTPKGAFAFEFRFEGTQLEQCEGCDEWFPKLNQDVLDKFSLCDPCKEREEILYFEPDPDEAYDVRRDELMGLS